MIYIGIDPGKDGAMAIISNIYDAVNISTFDAARYMTALKNLSGKYKIKCCLERVGAMPRQGVTSMFKFGENYGFIQGLLTAYCIPYELVTPQRWKKEFGITGDKNSSIAVCKRLFPDVSLRRTERCKKDSADFAEALLMAEYCRRKFR